MLRERVGGLSPILLAAAAALLLAEGLFLGLRFDSASLRRLPAGWWTLALDAAPRVLPISAAVAAAALLVVGPRGDRRLSGNGPTSATRWSWPYLSIHLVAFAALFAVCFVLFDATDADRHVSLWVVAWLVLSAATALLWLFALVPPRTVVLLGRRVGDLLLVSVVIGVCAWAAGRLTQQWWGALRLPTLTATHTLLRAVDPSAWANPSEFQIGARDFWVIISPDCSGCEGVGLMWVFLGTYFWLFRSRLRFPNAFLLLPLATGAVWAANVLRIAALIVIGARLSPEVALGGFHSYAGSVLFCGVALATAAVAQRSALFARPLPGETDLLENPAAPYLVPFLLAVALALVTGLISTSGFDHLYPVRVVVVAVALWMYRRAYPPPSASGWGLLWPLSIGAAVFVFWIAVEWVGGSGGNAAAGPGMLPPSWRAPWVVFRALGAIVIAPAVEELAFRGYLARRLTASRFESVPLSDVSAFAVVGSSILYGALCGQWLSGFVAGLAYAWTARRTGRLTDAIVAHATSNAFMTVYVLTTGKWWLWG